MTKFFEDIKRFNAMYKLPIPSNPSMQYQRMEAFQTIIQEEVEEGELIVNKYNSFEAQYMAPSPVTNTEVLTDLADWFGDMMIYCCSEMHRYGLNPEIVLGIIMQSNFSKLGADGEPIYDERGKVMKGPNYWKPEPELKNYIELAMAANNSSIEPIDNDAQDNNEEENG